MLWFAAIRPGSSHGSRPAADSTAAHIPGLAVRLGGRAGPSRPGKDWPGQPALFRDAAAAYPAELVMWTIAECLSVAVFGVCIAAGG